ncbi:hypothetical protein GpartN1_g4180.t1 [Galdieria partita]|uniref:Uncharacterized protein n=1 Tax=Galdieria partita TaxID=83374 RepID=A0A9C7PXJ0_9RHOD|nr:hypothetical protein GpartN1_g4180.t1 [Galdieria partita]
MPIAAKHVSPSPALRKLCETNDENELTEQVKQEVIQELVDTWEFGRAVNVNYTLDKAAVAGAAVNEKAVVEYLQARAQSLCDMGLLDEQGMHAILQGRLQKRDSAYEDIENAVNAHWPPRKRKSSNQQTEATTDDLQQLSMDDITNKITPSKSHKDRRATIMALGDAFTQAYDNIIYHGKQSKLSKPLDSRLAFIQSKAKETPSTTQHCNMKNTSCCNDIMDQSSYSHMNHSNPDHSNLRYRDASYSSFKTPTKSTKPPRSSVTENRQCCVLQ